MVVTGDEGCEVVDCLKHGVVVGEQGTGRREKGTVQGGDLNVRLRSQELNLEVRRQNGATERFLSRGG